MQISVNFQMTELKHDAQPISMGVAVKPTKFSPIHVFYAEFSDVDYSKVESSQLTWLNNNVINKLLMTEGITDEGIDEVGDILTSDDVKTTVKRGTCDTIGRYFMNWLRYIKREYNMMDHNVEFISDIPAYDKVMMTKVLNMNGIDMGSLKISPYDICLNTTIANHYHVTLEKAFELDRYELLDNYIEDISIYNELSGDRRIVTQAFYNCLETLLLFNRIN